MIQAIKQYKIDSQQQGQWYKENTVYQILEVSPPTQEDKSLEKNIFTTILAKERGIADESKSVQSKSFDKYPLDEKTIEKLQDYPKEGDGKNISSYLPSSGVVFSKGFFKA
ncbi:MAG: hypothetical protein AAFW70_30765, partial [Cyanobacteria bacterium J06635_10]